MKALKIIAFPFAITSMHTTILSAENNNHIKS